LPVAGLNRRTLKRSALVLLTLVLYALHQDLWFWREARPLVFGFLPMGLFYHAAYSVAASLLLFILVKAAWPSHLEDEATRGEKEPPP
jgi:Protein of unknown function (DUF3311)